MSALFFASGALSTFAVGAYQTASGAAIIASVAGAVAMIAGVIIDANTRRG